MAESKTVIEPVSGKTAVIVGTRPGIIKMSPVINELNERTGVRSFVIHAGQHYSYELDGKMFEDLGLDKPKHRLDGIEEKEYHGEQTAAMLEGIESILLEEQPENVLVCGDANFNLAGALAARKLQLNLGHVEAGLRSNDWRMPEEHNRVMIDHISDYLFVPTDEAYENAINDNVNGNTVITGNTIVDAVERNIKHSKKDSRILEKLSLEENSYVLFTAHREENVDDLSTLSDLIDVIEGVTTELATQVVYPIHPRTEKRLDQFGLGDKINNVDGLSIIDPVGYLDFLQLIHNARLIMTDSGGIQEEACILGVPCVTLRENTERPETVTVGANAIAGTKPSSVLSCVRNIEQATHEWENPFGDGKAAERIIDTIPTDK